MFLYFLFKGNQQGKLRSAHVFVLFFFRGSSRHSQRGGSKPRGKLMWGVDLRVGLQRFGIRAGHLKRHPLNPLRAEVLTLGALACSLTAMRRGPWQKVVGFSRGKKRGTHWFHDSLSQIMAVQLIQL